MLCIVCWAYTCNMSPIFNQIWIVHACRRCLVFITSDQTLKSSTCPASRCSLYVTFPVTQDIFHIFCGGPHSTLLFLAEWSCVIRDVSWFGSRRWVCIVGTGRTCVRASSSISSARHHTARRHSIVLQYSSDAFSQKHGLVALHQEISYTTVHLRYETRDSNGTYRPRCRLNPSFHSAHVLRAVNTCIQRRPSVRTWHSRCEIAYV